MTILGRWTSGIVSRIDAVVTRIENQEALVNAAIDEARRAAARARVQLGRVREDGNRLAEQHAAEAQGCERWKERALGCPPEEEARAMECLRRSKVAGKRQQELKQRLNEHAKAQKQLSAELERIEAQVAHLIEKRNRMRTRQSQAEAMAQVRGAAFSDPTCLSEVFERWETQVTEVELEAGLGPGRSQEDELEAEFSQEEQRRTLRSELEQLRWAQDKERRTP